MPFVIIGTLLGVSIIGAFQLRQNERVSEKTFLSLMSLALRHLPSIHARRRNPEQNS
jgi:hypothetical protein